MVRMMEKSEGFKGVIEADSQGYETLNEVSGVCHGLR